MLQQPESGAVQPNVSPSSQQQAESRGVQIQPIVSPSLQQPAESRGVQIQPNVIPSLQQAESGGVQVQLNVSPSSQQQPESGGVQVQPNVSPSSQQQANSGGVQIQPNVSPSQQQPTESGGVQIQPSVSPSLQQPAESGGVQEQPNANPSLKKPADSIGFFLRPPKSINGLPAGNLGESAHQPPLSEAEIAAVEFWEGRNHSHYRKLYLAAMKGDWKSGQSIIKSDPNALNARITYDSRTALHVAASFCRWEFILKLLEDLKPELIEAQDTYGFTVLHFVARGGSLKTAKALIQKNARLLQIMENVQGLLPLHFSILGENKELVWYLTSITEPIESASLPRFIRHLIQFGFHALHVVTKYPESTFAKDQRDKFLLHRLAFESQHFFSGSNLGFLERLIYKFVCVEIKNAPTDSVLINVKDILESTEDSTQVLGRFKRLFWKAITQLAPTIKIVRDTKLKNKCAVELVHHVCKHLSDHMTFLEIFNILQYPHSILGVAVKRGNEEVVRTLLQYFLDLINIEAMPQRNILQAAIEYRQEKIVNTMKEIYSAAVITNSCGSPIASEKTTLHLVGKLAPTFKLFSVSGAAFQMQRELQWFKEVEKIIKFPFLRDKKNKKDETADDIFRKAHEDLAEKGERWMKDTANSCMLVSTLIATVLFAAAFTVPGGNNNDNGIPIFLRTDAFVVFAISAALGLFSSLTSLLMFLSILTARYAQGDFLKSLPTKLIIGLGSLFFAIAAMIIAFGATLTIVLSKNWHWVSVPITLLATFPVAIFVMLQLPLFIQMVWSTYGPGMFRP